MNNYIPKINNFIHIFALLGHMILLNYHKCDYITPLFKFLMEICYVVNNLVTWYFITFMFCWKYILLALVTMIDNYFELLQILIYQFTSYPFCIYGTICVFICMSSVYFIIKKL